MEGRDNKGRFVKGLTPWNKVLTKGTNEKIRDKKIIKIYKKGKSIKSIGNSLRCNRKIISAILKKNNMVCYFLHSSKVTMFSIKT